MPVSNGQVSRYDIRRDAVHTEHIIDEAIATAKIPDLAVTFPDKIDDPIWTEVQFFDAESGATLTTTPQITASVDISVPAWVDRVSIFAIGEQQVSNTSGSTINARARLELDGDKLNGGQQRDDSRHHCGHGSPGGRGR